MRLSHYPNKCPVCKASTDIIFGNKLGPDEIVCKACGWKRALLVSTVLSAETRISLVMRKMMRGNDKRGKSAQKNK